MRFAQAVLRFRWAILIVVALVTAAAAVSASRVRFDASVDIWFLEDDPELATYHRFLKTFETDEIAVVALFADDVFTADVSARIARATDAIKKVKGVGRVRSLANATVFAEEALGLVPLSEARDVRARALADPLLTNVLVSPDATSTAIIVELTPTSFDEKVLLVRELQKIARAEASPTVRILVGGTPAVNEAVFRYSQRDFSTLGLLALFLVVALTFFTFRTLSATLLPLGVVVISVVWVFGLMGALDVHLDLVSQSLATVIFAVGIADAIHVMKDYQHRLAAGAEKSEAIALAIKRLLLPCLFTSLTTAAGMLSLTSSALSPIARFGWLSAVGVFAALLVSLTFLPAMLSLLPPPRLRPPSPWLARLSLPDRSSRHAILLTAGFITIYSLVEISFLHVGANPMAYFKENDPVRTEIAEIDRRLGGSTSIELLIDAPDGGLSEPSTLARLERLARWLEERPAVERVLSVSDALRVLNGAVTGTVAMPKTKEQVAQLYLLMEEDEGFSAMVQEEASLGRMSARVRMIDAGSLVKEIPAIDRKLAEEFSDPELTVTPTGFVKLISEMEIYIVDSQVRSLSMAFIVVSLLMVLVLRSFKLGMFAMIPNLLPVLYGLGFMAICRIKLDPGTAMIGSITLGLVVDDTVHVMARLREGLSEGLDLDEAIQTAITEAGSAVVTTSAILAAGFGVLAFGSFTPNVFLGLISALVILLALVCDLVLLPAALLTIRPKF